MVRNSFQQIIANIKYYTNPIISLGQNRCFFSIIGESQTETINKQCASKMNTKSVSYNYHSLPKDSRELILPFLEIETII
jgi:hypothetical protein